MVSSLKLCIARFGLCAGLALMTAAVAVEPVTAQPQTNRQRIGNLGSAFGSYLAGRFASKMNDYNQAADFVDQALLRDSGNPLLVFQAFRLRLAAGRMTAAVDLAPKVAAAVPGDPLPNLVLALDAVRRKDFAAAEQALAHLPSDPRLGFLRPYLVAWVKAGQKDYVAAQASLESAGIGGNDAATYKTSSLYLLHSGLIDELAGKKDDAKKKLQDAYAAPDAASLRVAMTLASFYRRNGNGDEAKKVMADLFEKSGELVPLDALLSDKASRLTTISDGMAEVLFDVFVALAQGSTDNDQLDDAAVIFGRLTLQMRSDYDLAKLLLGDLMAQQQHMDAALQTYRTVEASSPMYWRARLKVAATLDELGKTNEATKLLEGMIAERKERADAAQALGDLLRSKEKFAEAAKAYDIAIERTPKPEKRSWTLFYARGIALERSNQWSKAEADFRKALELSPDQPYILNYLGYSWVDQNINVDEGKRLLEKAVRLKPNDGAIVDSLGWANYRLGDMPRAIDLLERAVALVSTDWTVNDHLGDAYWRVGRKLEARFQWQRALTLKPEADKVQEIENKISSGLPDASPKQ
ncbi:MAG: tetratricopeptide repeat protein [Rhodospirillales bacterium]